MDKAFLEGLGLDAEAVEAILAQRQLEEQGYQEQLRRQAVEHALDRAVQSLGGRNARAIRALLDEEAIASSEDVTAAAKQAVGRVRREHGYLFRTGHISADGMGSARVLGDYSAKEIGEMSMEEYRRLRRK